MTLKRRSFLRALATTLGLSLAATLGGCISVDVGSEASLQVQYRLDDVRGANAGSSSVVRRTSPLPRSLLVTAVPTGASGESFAMMYSKAPQQRASYQNAGWTERPSARMAQLVVDRLAVGGNFESVALLGRNVGGDLLLNLSVAEIYHDASATPGRGTVEVSAELVERASRRLITRQRFSASVSLEGPSGSAGAAAALSRATGQVIDELANWLDSTVERMPAARR